MSDNRDEAAAKPGTPRDTEQSVTERARQLLLGNPLVPLILAGSATIAAVVALFLWASTPEYRVLFNNLEEADGGRVVSELEALGVPYELGANGRTIRVPGNRVHRLRLQLAEQGLPRGGNMGFELMDDQEFGISQFAEQVNFQRSLEGELARSIQSLNAVANARVHLSMAKPSVFVRENEPAKASVVLTLHSGRTLSDGQVSAIEYLVSSSVRQLAADRVTVVDQNGNLLSGKDGGDRIDGSQLAYTQELERRYQQRIENILRPLFGARNFHVQVAAEIDFSAREETVEAYRPNQGENEAAVRSTQLSGSLNGSDALARGIPGALSNTPPGWLPSPIDAADDGAEPDAADDGGAPEGSADALRYDNVVNYEVDRNITHIQHQRGVLQRLTVAAVINYRDGLDDDGNPTQVPLTDAEMQQVEALVSQAMGFSAARGDELEVVNSPFAAAYLAGDEEEVREWWQRPEIHELIRTLSRYLFALLLALLMYRLIVRPIVKRATQAPQDGLVRHSTPEGGVAMDLGQAEPGETEAGMLPQRRIRRSVANKADLDEVRELSQDDPRLVAMVVRSWMNSDGQR